MTAHSEWARQVGVHCGSCGALWPKRNGRYLSSIRCPQCGSLPCRADTTDSVAPDPPCTGFKHVMLNEEDPGR